MDKDIEKTYGNRLRLRVCGLCWDDNRLLMVNHRGLSDSNFWAPPGGGVNFGEKVADRLILEFREETHLDVVPGPFAFACEYVKTPIHAVELFFQVRANDFKVRKGNDPELPIITDVRFMTVEEILSLPSDQVHGIFRRINSGDDLMNLKGFFTI